MHALPTQTRRCTAGARALRRLLQSRRVQPGLSQPGSRQATAPAHAEGLVVWQWKMHTPRAHEGKVCAPARTF